MAAISGETWSRSSSGMRGEIVFSVTLESIPQRELNQTRRAHGLRDPRECRGIFHVGLRRIGEVRMVPDVEEVGRKAEGLPLAEVEILDEREIPVLLVRPAIDVATKVAEIGCTEIWILHRITSGTGIRGIKGIHQGRGGEIVDVQIAVEAVVDVAARLPCCDRTTRSKLTAERRGESWADEGAARPGIDHGEGRSGLEDRNAADRPSLEKNFLCARS